jgi:AAA+ superfamily predicted ATPase
VTLLRRHFGKTPLESIVAATRTFPPTSRVDLQSALDQVFSPEMKARVIGVHNEYSHETLTVPHLTRDGDQSALVGPLQHDEIDVGEALPARCLKRGLWLAHDGAMPFIVLQTPAERYGQSEGIHVEIAVPPGERGLELSRSFLDKIEKRINLAGSYRGKIISLEAAHRYSGKAGEVRVHKLRSVSRDEVILPDKTLKLLERNVSDFIKHRDELKRLGMPTRKGLLFYGPPGTGKTHTIHYLASQLAGHTTLLITSEQVGLLEDYFLLARFLQPAMVVIEDVDLIARSREGMRGACEEALLNKLLNEMDGLREDAAILFVLTTNRPDQLEAALASRPGRVDQAIEFPLPDAEGRRKLVRLYSRGLPVPEPVVESIVEKTKKASAAFIKELMRRSAQFLIEGEKRGGLTQANVEAALDEMLFSGGSLNVKLLGGAVSS